MFNRRLKEEIASLEKQLRGVQEEKERYRKELAVEKNVLVETAERSDANREYAERMKTNWHEALDIITELEKRVPPKYEYRVVYEPSEEKYRLVLEMVHGRDNYRQPVPTKKEFFDSAHEAEAYAQCIIAKLNANPA
ncbi:MAG: hypothetical protein EBR82_74890 [Caulobacteraceae bacterium]|nr:hypothetical protein [Caulobacteraceae bacterium]